MNTIIILLIALAIVIVAKVAAPLVLGPLLIKSNHTQSAAPVFRELDPNTEDVPPEARAHFEAGIPGLTALGFAPVACMEMTGYTQKAVACFTLFENPSNRDLAMLTAFYVDLNGRRRFRSAHAEFVAAFADGRNVTTSNTSELSATPRNPRKKKYPFPMLKDLARLWRAHQALASREAPGERKPPPKPGEAGRMLTEGIAQEHEFYVSAGYLFFDPAAQAFRPTWKGACLMTWRLCWPFKEMRRAQALRQAQALLLELGV